MQIGIIGLGRMGANIARRLMRAGHTTVVHDQAQAAAHVLQTDGAQVAPDLPALVQRLAQPRVLWLMLPAGAATENTIDALAPLLDADDVVIDGGNTFYKDDIRRARALTARSIHYLDVGTSGGVWGLERGYCMMIGGEAAIVRRLDAVFAALAPGPGDIPPTPGRQHADSRAQHGYIHAGPVGAGHFVKMVHNGIEYGMMQALAEGFHLLHAQAGPAVPQAERFALDVADIAEVWRRGSVVSSWLLDLTAGALAEDPALASFAGPVSDSGEGRWTIEAAIANGVPTPVLASALFARFQSQQDDNYADRVLSAMRFAFGGHRVPKTP